MRQSKLNMEFARKYGILIVLVAMWSILMMVSPTFRTTKNAVNILRQVSVNGIIAIGMTFVIMTGGIDLTVGSLVAVAGVVSGSILVGCNTCSGSRHCGLCSFRSNEWFLCCLYGGSAFCGNTGRDDNSKRLCICIFRR